MNAEMTILDLETLIEARDFVAVVDDSARQPCAAVRTTILDRTESAVGKTKRGDGQSVQRDRAHAPGRARFHRADRDPHQSLRSMAFKSTQF